MNRVCSGIEYIRLVPLMWVIWTPSNWRRQGSESFLCGALGSSEGVMDLRLRGGGVIDSTLGG